MPTFWRLVRPVVLLALIAAAVFPLGVHPTAAQDDEGETPVTIMGTNQLEPLVIALRDAFAEQYPDAPAVTIDPRGGQNTGFSELCQGNVDVVMSTDPISDTQIQACANNDQAFIEVVLAYEAVVLLATPDAGLTCTAPDAVYEVWAFGAPEEVQWSDLGAEDYNEPVSFYGPDALMPTATLFADLIPAGRLRDDITAVDDPAVLVETVQEEAANAFGYMSLAQYEALDTLAEVSPLQLQTEAGDCVAPTLSALGTRTYPLARADYLYLNAASAAQPGVQAFMQFVLADENGAAAIVPEQGYTLADAGTYEYGLNNVTTGNTGRTFSRPLTPVTLSADAEGTVQIAGTAMLRELTNTLVRSFTSRFTGATVDERIEGNTQGWQAFCSGEVDIVQTTREPSAEEQALCTENGIDPYVLDLGYDALVIAVPAANDAIACMDSASAAALLRAGSDEEPPVQSWDAVNPGWPEQPILLVVPPRRTGETDFLIFHLIGELSFAMRRDVTEDADPVYRAEGVANTDNGMTYLWWSDLQAAGADVYLVPVQGEGECVAPTPDTIMNGTYPLAYPQRYYVNRDALADNAMLRALVWHMFGDDMLAEYETLNAAGFDFDALKLAERDAVYEMLAAYEDGAEAATETDDTGAEAEDADAEAAEEATEPEEEPADEPTEEPTEEPTSEPADEPSGDEGASE